ncbi:D-arabinono-1,4-lactone oxidase [Martelella alba]|uniref:D-arabinono-1,4-lactone oxidase n=1 Tax=Martelella alba TaxID=2590451 RepID=UPI001E418842|nr:D-arabinono-1,4-lactone oxidase [Martelella alba]
MERQRIHYPHRYPQLPARDEQIWNWAQNEALGAKAALRRPENETQLREMVAQAAGRVRIVGTRLSAGDLLRLDQPGDILLDPSALSGLLRVTDQTATFAAATPLHDVFRILTGMGRMLPCSPGVIDLQTLAGAIATGTHGQGLDQSSLADEIVRLRLILANGEAVDMQPGDPVFGAAQLSLGALGVVSEITLRTQPLRTYTCQKSARNADNLSTALYEWNHGFPFSKAWWFPAEKQVHVWCAKEADDDEARRYRENGRQPLSRSHRNDSLNDTVDRLLGHMRHDTQIKEREGKPYQTVNRFKDFADVTGDINQLFCRGIATPQINIEIGVPLESAGDVITDLTRWHAESRPHMHYPIILRCTGPSAAWLSPAQGRATCFFGFVVYYAQDGSLSPEGVNFINAAEKRLARYGGRPHWGKYYDRDLYRWPQLYPYWARFREVRAALDPAGKFTNRLISELFDQQQT